MSGGYIGVDGKARKIKGGYIGVDGKARKIKKGYIGDENGVARLCWVDNPFDPVFANNSWEQIALACQTGAVPDSWAVGDQKTMTIGGTDYAIDIIGKNHDDYADGSGKAPLTFQLHDCYETKHNIGGNSWTSCTMRTSFLPSILDLMSVEVQSNIKYINKSTTIGNGSTTITVDADKLFLLSEVEILGKASHGTTSEGEQYEYYTINSNNTKKTLDGKASYWWTRSPNKKGTQSFCIILDTGECAILNPGNSNGVSFAFCF